MYWQPQFDSAGGDAAAQGYVQLLGETYDAIKAIRPDATVSGAALDSRGNDDPGAGARSSHSPTTFIRDLGAAYRASGRKTPLMDVFDPHVYGDTSALPPSMPHSGSTTITEGDYAKLVALLGKAFDGTAQRGSTLPIVYGEFGVETDDPGAKTGATAAPSRAIDASTRRRRRRYYAEAFRLALLPAERDRDHGLPRRRRARARRVAVGPVLRGRNAEVVAAARSATQPPPRGTEPPALPRPESASRRDLDEGRQGRRRRHGRRRRRQGDADRQRNRRAR